MKTLLAIPLLALAISAAAADLETRTGSTSPECADRNANPDKCVTQDGPPPLPIVRKKPASPPLAPNETSAMEQPKPSPAEKVRQTAPPRTN